MAILKRISLLFLFTIIACHVQQSQKIAEENTITDKTWKLIELNGNTITQNENQKAPYFILNSETEAISGYSGCNSFNGGYTITRGNQIKFSKMISTMMACMDVPYEQEFLNVFETVDNYFLSGNTLSINKGKMAPLAKFIYSASE